MKGNHNSKKELTMATTGVSKISKPFTRRPDQDVTRTDPATTVPFPIKGVKFKVFEEFIGKCGGKEKLKGLTTTQVGEEYLIPQKKRYTLPGFDPSFSFKT